MTDLLQLPSLRTRSVTDSGDAYTIEAKSTQSLQLCPGCQGARLYRHGAGLQLRGSACTDALRRVGAQSDAADPRNRPRHDDIVGAGYFTSATTRSRVLERRVVEYGPSIEVLVRMLEAGDFE